ncbi:hypothetical protein ACP70R_030161 [Stipagrostis hirtigluma subsp. patula]
MAGGETSTVRSGSEGGNVLESVARIKSQLAAAEEDGGTTLELLRQLQAVPMTYEVLDATKIGWEVNALRKKAPSEQARELAAALYRQWKALADEHFRSTRKQQQPPATGDDAAPTKPALASKAVAAACPDQAPKVAASVRRSPPPIKEKRPAAPSGSASACKHGEEVVTTKVDGARTTKKRHEGRKDAAAAKKQRTIDAPGQPQPEHRPVAVQVQRPRVPQQAAAAPNKPAPAPSTRTNKPGVQASRATAAGLRKTTVAKRVSPSPASAASLANKGTKQPAAAPKPSGSSGASKPKGGSTTCIDEASLARATRRLHERYKEAETAKERRRIQVINPPVKAR